MTTIVDYLVIGAGPAGVQLGYFLERDRRDYLILEKSDNPGSFFKALPRRRLLISINKIFTGFDDVDFNMRWDWNSLLSDSKGPLFKEYSKEYYPAADDLLVYIKEFAQKYQLNIRYQSKVCNIAKRNDKFIVTLSNNEHYQANKLIVATGVSIPFVPNIPGIEFAENYMNVSLDKKRYENKRVLILGKGNSGFETADMLSDVTSLIHVASPHPVKFAWRSHHAGHLRAINVHLLETYQFKQQNALINGEIQRIDYNNEKYSVTIGYHLADGEVETIEYDRVIVCTGFRLDGSIFDAYCQTNQYFRNT